VFPKKQKLIFRPR